MDNVDCSGERDADSDKHLDREAFSTHDRFRVVNDFADFFRQLGEHDVRSAEQWRALVEPYFQNETELVVRLTANSGEKFDLVYATRRPGGDMGLLPSSNEGDFNFDGRQCPVVIVVMKRRKSTEFIVPSWVRAERPKRLCYKMRHATAAPFDHVASGARIVQEWEVHTLELRCAIKPSASGGQQIESRAKVSQRIDYREDNAAIDPIIRESEFIDITRAIRVGFDHHRPRATLQKFLNSRFELNNVFQRPLYGKPRIIKRV